MAFSSEELQEFKKACQILTDLDTAGLGWQLNNPKARRLPWPTPQNIGLEFDLGQNNLTAEKLAWLWKREWVARILKDNIILAPLVPAMQFQFCYHTTPVENVQGIRERGLLTAREVGQSTSTWMDGQDHIHVSFFLEDAKEWAKDHLLGKTNPGQEWAILRIDSACLKGRVFRDPASATGYILEDQRVPWSCLEPKETFHPNG